MPQQTFANGEQLASVRAKLNANANDAESRLVALDDELDAKADLVSGTDPETQLSANTIGAIYSEIDLDALLPATDPGDGKPWLDTSGLLRVGAGAGGSIPYIPSPTPVDGRVAMFDGLGGLKATGTATLDDLIFAGTGKLWDNGGNITQLVAKTGSELSLISSGAGAIYLAPGGTLRTIYPAMGGALMNGGYQQMTGSPPPSGAGLSMGYYDGNYGWLQTFGSVGMALNPLGNNVSVGTTVTTNATFEVNGTTRLGFQGAGFFEVTKNSLTHYYQNTNDKRMEYNRDTNPYGIGASGSLLFSPGGGTHASMLTYGAGICSPALHTLGFIISNGSGTMYEGGKVDNYGLTVGRYAAGEQKTLKVQGNSTADCAPVLSLFRAGAREGFIAQGVAGMYIGNTGGLASYLDADLVANADITIDAAGNTQFSGQVMASTFISTPAALCSTDTPLGYDPGGSGGLTGITTLAGNNSGSWLEFDRAVIGLNDSKAWIGSVYNGNYGTSLLLFSSKQGNAAYGNDAARNALLQQDVIVFYTGASGATDTAERMRIDSVGNVSVGVPSAGARLHVRYGPGNTGLLINDGFGNDTYIPYSDGKNYVRGVATVLNDTGGNVGIGTASPGYPLDLGGTLGNKLALFNNGTTFYGFGIQPGRLVVTSDNVEAMNLVSGNVGIGTAAPHQKLTIGGDNGSAYGLLSAISFERVAFAPGQSCAEIQCYRTSSGDEGELAFATRSSGGALAERMRIGAWGQVAIGKAPAAYLLDVNGEGNFSSWIASNGIYVSGPATTTVGINSGVPGRMHFRTGGIDGQVTIDEIGRVGIGTASPSALLDIQNNVTVGGGVVRWGNTPTFGVLSWDVNKAMVGAQNGKRLHLCANDDSASGSQLVIDTTGNVGIGTVSPGARLDITGTPDVVGHVGLGLQSGNGFDGYNSNQVTFGYGPNYRHAIKSRHNATVNENNAIDFFIWQTSDTLTGIGSYRAMSVASCYRPRFDRISRVFGIELWS